MSRDLLQLELRLLIARHGRSRVLEELALLDGRSIEDVEHDLQKIENRSKEKRKKKDKTVAELVDAAAKDAPARRDTLELLATQYEQKVFLSQLRRAKKLLIDHGVNVKSVTTRKLALPHVLRVLATIPDHELRHLLEAETDNDKGDLAILAGAILGRQHRD